MRDGEEHTPITLSLVNTSSSLVCQSVKEAIDYKNYSSLNQLLCVTSYVILFIQMQKMRSKIHKLSSYRSNLYSIASSFACEIQYLFSQCFPCPLLVKQFGLFLDDQKVLCCKVRLNNPSLCFQSKNPAILPQNDYLVELLILWAHQSTRHSAVIYTCRYSSGHF